MKNPVWQRASDIAKITFQVMRQELLEEWTNGQEKEIYGDGAGQPIDAGAEIQDNPVGNPELEQDSGVDPRAATQPPPL